MKTKNTNKIATILFFVGLLILNSWIYDYLGQEFNFERILAMISISLVSLFSFYKNDLFNLIAKSKTQVETSSQSFNKDYEVNQK